MIGASAAMNPLRFASFPRFAPAVLLGLLWLAGSRALQAEGRPTAGATFVDGPTTAVDVITLPSAEAARRLPARVSGVVLLNRIERESAIVVHDATGAIYVRLAKVPGLTLQRGDRVAVEGITDPGRFAPIIKNATCRVLGKAPLPEPTPVTLSSLFTGRFDGQWVEATGVVRNVSPRRNWPRDTVVEIVADEVRLPIMFDDVPLETARGWLDATIKVRGVCFQFCNPKGQLFYSQIAVPAGETFEVVEPGPADPYALPVRALASLLRYNRAGSETHRVHVRGTVSYAQDGRFFIQDGADGLEVQTRQKKLPEIGAAVDVVGFVTRGVYSPMLEDAEFRAAGMGQELVPRVIEKRFSEADGGLVRTQGRLVNLLWRPNEWILLLEREKNVLFNAYVPRDTTDPDDTPPWEIGSMLSLTGVARAIMGSPVQHQWQWEPRSFYLLLRSYGDVAVLERAPWWRSSRGYWTAISTLAVVTAGLGVVVVRSRGRMREQRRQREAAEAKFAAVLQERSRVAREIHDTLAQGLTSVSMQIEMTKEQLATQPESARQHLEIARTLVRGSLHEARRSIWGLRPQILETKNLGAALTEIGEQLVANSAVEFSLRTSGDASRLPPDVETELLRIGQEAITNAVKHARARRIEVTLDFLADSVRLRVVDDGRGFRPPESERSDASGGFGVTGMRERAAQLRGRLTVSSRGRRGTELRLTVPIS